MLFDLRGKGRRRVIKVVYVTLAFLMGGGLVLFGIGGDVSGGLVDAITGAPQTDTDERASKQAASAAARTRANPDDAQAWADLTRARIQVAGSGDRLDTNTGQYTDEGKQRLRLAVSSWNRYLELTEGQDTEDKSRLASRMVQTFVALNDLTQAARAQEIVAEDRQTSGTYAQLAVLSYQAGQTRKGDLAAEKAVELADEDEREALKGQLESAKQQGIVNQVTPPAEE